jgi:RNA polymerase sigma-70 factor (ECF subfamily)
MPPSDQNILQRVLSGDQKAYSEIVDRHKDKAMTLAMRILKNKQDAEEAVQDAFIRAFQGLGRFEWRSSFSTWFYRIVFNVCSTALSRRGVHLIGFEDDGLDGVAPELHDPSPTLEANVESAEVQRIILEEIDRLPAAYSAVLTLFFLQEMSYAEIVEATGMPLGTVKAKLFRGRSLLREAIASRIREEGSWGLSRVAATVV